MKSEPTWPRTLSKFDYDFGSVPNDEWEACAYYEYARESRSVISEVNYIRFVQRVSGEFPKSIYQKQFFSFSTQIRVQLAKISDFPGKSWREVTSDRTQDHVKEFALAAYCITHHNQPQAFTIFPSCPPPKEEMALEKKSGRTVGCFSIDVTRGEMEIVAAFQRELEKHYPSLKTKAQGGRKGSPGDALQHLTALRLRYLSPTLTAAKKNLKEGNVTFYDERKSWDRACRSAVRRFRELLGLPKDEKPIHYTDGWRK